MRMIHEQELAQMQLYDNVLEIKPHDAATMRRHERKKNKKNKKNCYAANLALHIHSKSGISFSTDALSTFKLH